MILLIGYGNTLRRDDGAGQVLARMIADRGERNDLRLITVHQLVPELAWELAAPGVAAAVFMDAAACPFPGAVSVSPLRVDVLADEPHPAPVFGHHFSPCHLLAYAGLLGDVRFPSWLVTIPARDFGLGEGLSRATASLLPPLAGEVLHLLRDLPETLP